MSTFTSLFFLFSFSYASIGVHDNIFFVFLPKYPNRTKRSFLVKPLSLVRKYNREEAEKDLDWTIKFWKKESESIPT
jgi:hypothetical protein